MSSYNLMVMSPAVVLSSTVVDMVRSPSTFATGAHAVSSNTNSISLFMRWVTRKWYKKHAVTKENHPHTFIKGVLVCRHMGPEQYLSAFMNRIKTFGLYQSTDLVETAHFDAGFWRVDYVGMEAERVPFMTREMRDNVNTVSVVLSHEGQEHICDMVSLWLNPSFRNNGKGRGVRGYGTRLLDCVEGFAQDVGCTMLRGQPADMAAKICFYERHGFVKQGNDHIKRFVRNA